MFAATFAPQSNALRLTMHYGSDTRIPRAFVSTHLIERGVFVQEGGENVSSFGDFSFSGDCACDADTGRSRTVMQATLRCTIVALLAVMLASCAWQPTPLDHAHALSEMADKAADDSENVNHPVPHWVHKPINNAGRC